MLTAHITWNANPEIFNLFGALSIRYYSVFFVGGLYLAYLIMRNMYQKENISIDQLDKLTVYVFIGTLLGARLGHCLFYEPAYYLKHPLEIFLPFTWKSSTGFQFTGFHGLASHGGAIGVLLAIWIYCRQSKFDIWWVLDRIAIVTPLTGAFIRLGNFMNSEILGEPTTSALGIIFVQVDMLPRHPAQLYEAFSYLLIFGGLLLWFKHRRKKATTQQNGYIFGLFLLLLFGARFLIEFLKINQVDFENGMFFNMGQALSLPFIAAGIILMIFKGKKQEG